MAFLDNSGDIILDAVLTDTGRYRLAKGDGSFRIAKFALGDDEIDYSLYDTSKPSAEVDLNILNTPILEAFTDNAVALKSKLISIPRNDLLFLPVIKLFETQGKERATVNGSPLFCVSSDDQTDNLLTGSTSGIFSSEVNSTKFITSIVLDQGLDTTQISFDRLIDSDLKETQYIIEMDSRLGFIKDMNGVQAEYSFVDDDKIASYYLSLTNNATYVKNIVDNSDEGINSSIRGPRGTRLEFRIQAAMDLQYSDFLFQRLGTTDSLTINGVTNTLKYIDTNVRVTGATTGYRVDVPVRFIKV